MTAPLLINGVEIPVAVDSVKESEIEIADRGRAISGAYIGTRLESGIKRAWSGRIVTTDEAAAWAWRKMINGEGFGFSFASDLRDDHKGNQGWSTTNAVREAGGKYSAGQMSVAAAHTSTWLFPTGWSSSRWTIALWRLNGATWEHWVKVYGTTTVWKDGVAGVALPSWLTFDTSGIALAGAAGASTKYAEIVIHPFKWPSTWPAIVAARNASLTKPPYVGVSGTLANTGEALTSGYEFDARGRVDAVTVGNRGALSPLCKMDYLLEEK